MNLTLSQHAGLRMQQRCINPTIIDYLQEFGESNHDGKGACVLTFGKKAKYQLRKTLNKKEYAKIESKLKAYAVVSLDGHIITVGYQQQRFYL